jgi:L-amino acid N-acyltransferase YncA
MNSDSRWAIRAMTDQDIPAIVQILNDYIANSVHMVVYVEPFTESTAREHWRDECRANGFPALVATDRLGSGEPIAVAYLRKFQQGAAFDLLSNISASPSTLSLTMGS